MKISIHYKYNPKELSNPHRSSFFFLFKIVSKLTSSMMADMDRILGNKPAIRIPTKGEVNFQTQIQIPQAQR
jgi:hypothetical protein